MSKTVIKKSLFGLLAVSLFPVASYAQQSQDLPAVSIDLGCVNDDTEGSCRAKIKAEYLERKLKREKDCYFDLIKKGYKPLEIRAGDACSQLRAYQIKKMELGFKARIKKWKDDSSVAEEKINKGR